MMVRCTVEADDQRIGARRKRGWDLQDVEIVDSVSLAPEACWKTPIIGLTVTLGDKVTMPIEQMDVCCKVCRYRMRDNPAQRNTESVVRSANTVAVKSDASLIRDCGC